MHKISIYLAGNIQKGHEAESQIYWTDEDVSLLQKYCETTKVVFLNPASRSDDLSDQFSVFGRDMAQVFLSDLILVDARERRGLGVGAEMMWAKMHGIPVVTLAPINSHYRKKEVSLLGQTVRNWTHPFIESLSDFIVDDLKHAADIINKFAHSGENVKNASYVQKSMKYYQMSQFEKDLPMKNIIDSEDFLVDRMKKIQNEELLAPNQNFLS